GMGEGYFFFPSSAAFPFMSFLAALTYSGAGGNLLLAQSFYVKEKGYAMGKYAGRITSLITGKTEPNSVLGTTYVPTSEENRKFAAWWRMANIEHGVVFWGLGLFTMLLLALISYAATYGNPANVTGINFIYTQAEYISKEVGPVFASLMLIVTSLMLFATQLTVIDAAGRIITENIVLIRKNDTPSKDISRTYYLSIWALIGFGITMFLFGVKEPQFLIVTGAVINAVCMFVFAGLLIPMNKKLLPQPAQPAVWRQVVIWSIFIVLGLFTFLVIGDNFLK
ncbi:MAG: Nramp family divalent metal transporter, partial [Patescibacteria group bacterium]